MTISLSDLTAATASYIDSEVTVRVADVTANLNPGEEGTYTVKVRNAAEPTGVRLHATIDADDVFPRSAGANGSRTVTVRP